MIVGFIPVRWLIGVQPGGRRVHLGSLGTFTCAVRVVELSTLGLALGVIGLTWVHSHAPWSLSDSFMFVSARPGRRRGRSVHWNAHWGRRVYSGSGRALGVVSFIQVNSGTLWGLSDSFGFVGFIRARTQVHLGSLGSFVCVVGVVELFQVRPRGPRFWLGSLDHAKDFARFILVHCVHSSAPWESSFSFGFVLFIPGCRLV